MGSVFDKIANSIADVCNHIVDQLESAGQAEPTSPSLVSGVVLEEEQSRGLHGVEGVKLKRQELPEKERERLRQVHYRKEQEEKEKEEQKQRRYRKELIALKCLIHPESHSCTWIIEERDFSLPISFTVRDLYVQCAKSIFMDRTVKEGGLPLQNKVNQDWFINAVYSVNNNEQFDTQDSTRPCWHLKSGEVNNRKVREFKRENSKEYGEILKTVRLASIENCDVWEQGDDLLKNETKFSEEFKTRINNELVRSQQTESMIKRLEQLCHDNQNRLDVKEKYSQQLCEKKKERLRYENNITTLHKEALTALKAVFLETDPDTLKSVTKNVLSPEFISSLGSSEPKGRSLTKRERKRSVTNTDLRLWMVFDPQSEQYRAIAAVMGSQATIEGLLGVRTAAMHARGLKNGHFHSERLRNLSLPEMQKWYSEHPDFLSDDANQTLISLRRLYHMEVNLNGQNITPLMDQRVRMQLLESLRSEQNRNYREALRSAIANVLEVVPNPPNSTVVWTESVENNLQTVDSFMKTGALDNVSTQVKSERIFLNAITELEQVMEGLSDLALRTCNESLTLDVTEGIVRGGYVLPDAQGRLPGIQHTHAQCGTDGLQAIRWTFSEEQERGMGQVHQVSVVKGKDDLRKYIENLGANIQKAADYCDVDNYINSIGTVFSNRIEQCKDIKALEDFVNQAKEGIACLKQYLDGCGELNCYQKQKLMIKFLESTAKKFSDKLGSLQNSMPLTQKSQGVCGVPTDMASFKKLLTENTSSVDNNREIIIPTHAEPQTTSMAAFFVSQHGVLKSSGGLHAEPKTTPKCGDRKSLGS